MTDQSSKFVSVHSLEDRFEADLLVDALEREDIPALVRTYEETAYSGLFVPQKGWGKIMVPEEMASKAREVIKPLIRDLESGALFADPSEIDPVLWENLRNADRETICRNASVEYDIESDAYIVPFMGSEFACLPQRESIEPIDSGSSDTVDFQFCLTVLHYLLEAQDREFSMKWISEKDIPSGETFFRGPHKVPVDDLVETFDVHPNLFRLTSEALGGKAVKLGDAAYQFWAFPRIPLLVVFWEGDDEFRPALQILFDETITLHLRNLDTIWALLNVFCRSLLNASTVYFETDSEDRPGEAEAPRSDTEDREP